MYDPKLASIPLDLRPTEMLAPTPGAFLENLSFDLDGRLYVTNMTGRQILVWEEGKGVRTLCDLDVYPMSLERDVDGNWYVAARAESPKNREAMLKSQQVWRIDVHGRAECFLKVPQAKLLNGMVRQSPGVFLFADSIAGTIWRLDVAKREFSVWLQHESLGQRTGEGMTPGANGIKVWRNSIVVSNSSYRTFVYIDVTPDGAAGAVRVRDTGIATDDFVVQQDGTILLTTHRASVVRLRPNDEAHVLSQHEAVRGNTAVALGVRPSDLQYLYVVGDGGMWFGETLTACIARIDLGTAAP